MGQCGFVARGADGDELVAVAQVHARDAHLVHLTAEVIFALAAVSTPSLWRTNREENRTE